MIGLIAGGAVGTAVGILVAVNFESEKVDSRFELCFGAVLGLTADVFISGIGALIGAIASTDDVILYEIPPGYKFVPLKSLARYPDEEPEYLRAIE